MFSEFVQSCFLFPLTIIPLMDIVGNRNIVFGWEICLQVLAEFHVLSSLVSKKCVFEYFFFWGYVCFYVCASGISCSSYLQVEIIINQLTFHILGTIIRKSNWKFSVSKQKFQKHYSDFVSIAGLTHFYMHFCICITHFLHEKNGRVL